MKKRTWKRLPAKKGHGPLGTIRIRGAFSNSPWIWEHAYNPEYAARWTGTAWRNPPPPPAWWVRARPVPRGVDWRSSPRLPIESHVE